MRRNKLTKKTKQVKSNHEDREGRDSRIRNLPAQRPQRPLLSAEALLNGTHLQLETVADYNQTARYHTRPQVVFKDQSSFLTLHPVGQFLLVDNHQIILTGLIKYRLGNGMFSYQTIFYSKIQKSYFLFDSSRKSIFKKTIDKKPFLPYLCFNIPGCMFSRPVFSRMTERLIVRNPYAQSRLTVVNLERKKVEYRLDVKDEGTILDFCLFQQEETLVLLLTSNLCFLLFGFFTSKGKRSLLSKFDLEDSIPLRRRIDEEISLVRFTLVNYRGKRLVLVRIAGRGPHLLRILFEIEGISV